MFEELKRGGVGIRRREVADGDRVQAEITEERDILFQFAEIVIGEGIDVERLCWWRALLCIQRGRNVGYTFDEEAFAIAIEEIALCVD